MTDLSQHIAPETRTTVAWKYMLGDGKWRYQKDWSNGANMFPVFEITEEIAAALGAEQGRA